MRKKSILILLGLSLSSCTMKTSLEYSPVIPFQAKNNISLRLEAFEDCRIDCQKIGVMRNLYGMPIIKVYTEDNLPYWVKNALAIELANAGYSIFDNNSADVYIIEGVINEVYFNKYVCCFGRMTVKLIVKKNEDIIFQNVYKTSEWAGFSDGKETLKFNLQAICKQFTSDLNCLLLNNEL